MQPLQLAAILSLGLSAAVSLALFNSLSKLLKYFSLFLGISLVFEITNIILAQHGVENIVLYNFFHLLSFLFFAFLFRQIIRSASYRRVTGIFMVLFVLFFILNLFFIQDKSKLLTYPYTIGSLMMIVSSIIYFRQIFNTDEVEPVSNDTFFWICFAWLLFYGGTLPMFGMFNYLNRNFPALTSLYYDYIVFILNIVMNLLFLTGILCGKLFRKRFF